MGINVLIYYVKMHILLHKINFNEAMSRHLMVICSKDDLKNEVKKNNNWYLTTNWTKFLVNCYIKVKIDGLRIMQPARPELKIKKHAVGQTKLRIKKLQNRVARYWRSNLDAVQLAWDGY
jgi:hypothetical protein